MRLRAHPRSRGENPLSVRATKLMSGSSPLTRGKPSAWRRACRGRGLIPAHAGKTVTAVVAAEVWQAHPRSRGENGPRSR